MATVLFFKSFNFPPFNMTANLRKNILFQTLKLKIKMQETLISNLKLTMQVRFTHPSPKIYTRTKHYCMRKNMYCRYILNIASL